MITIFQLSMRSLIVFFAFDRAIVESKQVYSYMIWNIRVRIRIGKTRTFYLKTLVFEKRAKT